ncbi:DUF3290 domain-containing protein [Colibacter massiliensis]|uniref:DUF3290 domain-containing protein n=1 Tax=Colibacter massiliensis TaxID=1852379 RepID=UPI0023549B9E|nr:DUF3290 domain-containing protein [Colibacter massiliensis]
MQFYTYAFIEGQSHVDHMLQYALVALVLIVWLVAGIKYMHNRFQTKYRDLSVIFFLIGVFLLGANWEEYSRTRRSTEDMSRMAAFLNNFSYNMDVPAENLLVNSLSLKSGMIIRTGERDYYAVDFTGNAAAYKITRIYMIDVDIKVVDK